MDEYPWSMLITISLLTVNMWLASKVSHARLTASGVSNPHSPEIYNQSGFMRVFRNHANFHEHLMVFLPIFWIFAFCYSDVLAAAIGLLFLTGRIMYLKNYPESHRVGFIVSLTSLLILLLGVAFKSIYIITNNLLF
jgi:uncharacterized MAPEG superfamily protein